MATRHYSAARHPMRSSANSPAVYLLITALVGFAMAVAASAAVQGLAVADSLSFGVEMEFAGAGKMRVAHINDMPAENYERVLRMVASAIVGAEAADSIAIEHRINSVPHPKYPDSQPPRKVRTSLWTDPKGRTWRVTSEYVTAHGVYDGYEVVFPPLTDPAEAQAVAQALWYSEVLTAGVKSATHVHVNGTCLVSSSSNEASALGVVNMFLMHEQYEPLVRRLFRTRHLGGSRNPFSKGVSDVHAGIAEELSALPASERTVSAVRAAFDRRLDAEMVYVGLAQEANAEQAQMGDAAATESTDASMERFNSLKRVWKYHSLNLANLVPINPSIPPRKMTVEFRAFDLLPPSVVRLAVDFTRALVGRACDMAARGEAFVLGGELPRVPEGGEMSIDLLPTDPAALRAMADELLATLGLSSDEFAPLLESLSATAIGGTVFDIEHEVLMANWNHGRKSALPYVAPSAANSKRGIMRREARDSRFETEEVPAPAKRSSEDFFEIAQLTSTFHCLPNPCENGGTCVQEDKGKGVECICPPGYYGFFCEISFTTSTMSDGPTPSASSTFTPTHVFTSTQSITSVTTEASSEHVTPTSTAETSTVTSSTEAAPTSTITPPESSQSSRPLASSSAVVSSSPIVSSSAAVSSSSVVSSLPASSSSSVAALSSPAVLSSSSSLAVSSSPVESSSSSPVEPSSSAVLSSSASSQPSPVVSSSVAPIESPTSTPTPAPSSSPSSAAVPVPSSSASVVASSSSTAAIVEPSTSSEPPETSVPPVPVPTTEAPVPPSQNQLANAVTATFANITSEEFQSSFAGPFKDTVAALVNNATGGARRRRDTVSPSDVTIVSIVNNGNGVSVVFYIVSGSSAVSSAVVVGSLSSAADAFAAIGLALLSVAATPLGNNNSSSSSNAVAIGVGVGVGVGGALLIAAVAGYVIVNKRKSAGKYDVRTGQASGAVGKGGESAVAGTSEALAVPKTEKSQWWSNWFWTDFSSLQESPV